MMLLTKAQREQRFNSLGSTLAIHRAQIKRHASDAERVSYHQQGVKECRAERIALARILYPKSRSTTRLPHALSLHKFGEAID